jgi:hypothetical protein
MQQGTFLCNCGIPAGSKTSKNGNFYYCCANKQCEFYHMPNKPAPTRSGYNNNQFKAPRQAYAQPPPQPMQVHYNPAPPNEDTQDQFTPFTQANPQTQPTPPRPQPDAVTLNLLERLTRLENQRDNEMAEMVGRLEAAVKELKDLYAKCPRNT